MYSPKSVELDSAEIAHIALMLAHAAQYENTTDGEYTAIDKFEFRRVVQYCKQATESILFEHGFFNDRSWTDGWRAAWSK